MAAGSYQEPGDEMYASERTGWTGWMAFAGVMMIISGTLNALYGLVAVITIDLLVIWVITATGGRCARPDHPAQL